ncbi:universal stress protein [Actibacterium mucosum KCTC 23349]|uniref:Universal stress protein n=1 Tax=Actibacterium mucosum KCTC 23349 TaxID=1454373 RepID=A0A037ZEM2_9RHOB|nr:universal stress protein [Actibacterium mucosum]KAJ54068.1 universal stress protein [Actibacterium mucosum KCTC 23349]
MTRAVLCAVDISNANRDINVLQAAGQQASLMNAQLDVITVVPDFGMSVVGSFFNEGHHKQAIEHAKEELNAICEKALGADVNAGIRHVVATGTAYEEILKTASADGAGMIVIGAHKPDFKDYLLGPNAARVVRHSTCSVLVVRD